ncbi:FAD:protein FMN transferase [Rubinisphaera margarita]|uniref:FAD:protein FMN transferase n=1 Tax=Rubinisphaera margarita TaxID=2909586 RepID=UPI001EE90A5D|nr:FAD:protein FMN transferase [Rubinisphaera margarita]MCG6155612.1 FAD:protein FMN transferase [Rubinisphaera margarita]
MVRLNGDTMGTFYEVTIADPISPGQIEPIRTAIEDLLKEINTEMSTYDPESEISKFNASESGDWFAVSPRFAYVVEQSLLISRRTGGAFDPTVGPLVDLWHFGPRIEDRVVPSEETIASALTLTGSEHLETRLDPPAIRKSVPELRLDLSAIAKGFGVDEIAVLLRTYHLENFLVNIGGEVVAAGLKSDGTRWRLGIEKPIENAREIETIVYLTDVAMATSGDYRNFYEIDGTRYSHTIDPDTGRPVTHTLRSASVLASTCMEADALATAMLVLGPERGLELADRERIPVYLIESRDGELATNQTPGFEQVTEE